mgnify:CR=1 FL=1
MTIVTTYKAFASAYLPAKTVKTGSVQATLAAGALPPLVRQNAVRDEEPVSEPLVRQNAVSDGELASQHALEGVFASKRSQEEEDDERAVHDSLSAKSHPLLQQHNHIILGKVSGINAAKGSCRSDRDRIIINGKLLIVKWEDSDRDYAPATKDPLELSYDECAYVSVGKPKKRTIFMRHGELVGGEGRGGRYELEPISGG